MEPINRRFKLRVVSKAGGRSVDHIEIDSRCINFARNQSPHCPDRFNHYGWGGNLRKRSSDDGGLCDINIELMAGCLVVVQVEIDYASDTLASLESPFYLRNKAMLWSYFSSNGGSEEGFLEYLNTELPLVFRFYNGKLEVEFVHVGLFFNRSPAITRYIHKAADGWYLKYGSVNPNPIFLLFLGDELIKGEEYSASFLAYNYYKHRTISFKIRGNDRVVEPSLPVNIQVNPDEIYRGCIKRKLKRSGEYMISELFRVVGDKDDVEIYDYKICVSDPT
jgi:hypothetical protein